MDSLVLTARSKKRAADLQYIRSKAELGSRLARFSARHRVLQRSCVRFRVPYHNLLLLAQDLQKRTARSMLRALVVHQLTRRSCHAYLRESGPPLTLAPAALVSETSTEEPRARLTLPHRSRAFSSVAAAGET